MALTIRLEAPGDYSAIRDVVTAAFGRAVEADLVDRLRAEGDSVISLVAVESGRIVGHVLFSRMIAPFRALGLTDGRWRVCNARPEPRNGTRQRRLLVRGQPDVGGSSCGRREYTGTNEVAAPHAVTPCELLFPPPGSSEVMQPST